MTAIHKAIIGELSYQQQAKQIVLSLPCLLHKSTTVTCLILDEKGRQLAERKITHKEAQPSIAFHIPKLKAGMYNCWIEIEGKMHIQQLNIAKGKRNSFIGKLFNNY